MENAPRQQTRAEQKALEQLSVYFEATFARVDAGEISEPEAIALCELYANPEMIDGEHN
jgi:hypothetical protein